MGHAPLVSTVRHAPRRNKSFRGTVRPETDFVRYAHRPVAVVVDDDDDDDGEDDEEPAVAAIYLTFLPSEK